MRFVWGWRTSEPPKDRAFLGMYADSGGWSDVEKMKWDHTSEEWVDLYGYFIDEPDGWRDFREPT